MLVATFTFLAFLPHSFYFHSSFATDWICVLPTPKLMSFPSPFYLPFYTLVRSWYFTLSSSHARSAIHNFKTIPCATTKVMNYFCTRFALFARSSKYCHLLELYVKRATLPFIGCSFLSCLSWVRIQTTRSLVVLAGWSLTSVDTYRVYHPLHQMWSEWQVVAHDGVVN